MSGEKTQKATPKRLKDLRKKGVAARSFELPQAVSLVALVVVLALVFVAYRDPHFMLDVADRVWACF